MHAHTQVRLCWIPDGDCNVCVCVWWLAVILHFNQLRQAWRRTKLNALKTHLFMRNSVFCCCCCYGCCFFYGVIHSQFSPVAHAHPFAPFRHHRTPPSLTPFSQAYKIPCIYSFTVYMAHNASIICECLIYMCVCVFEFDMIYAKTRERRKKPEQLIYVTINMRRLFDK